MTNILSLLDSPREPIYTLSETDSQATSGKRRYNDAQKLFRVGDCLIMLTGSPIGGIPIINDLQSNPPHNARDVAMKILSLYDEHRINPNDQIENCDFIVSGFNPTDQRNSPGYLVIYRVHPDLDRRGRRHFSVTRAFLGSGSEESFRAFERDMEKQSIIIRGDLTEGVLYCYELGKKASTELHSNMMLQLGLITSEGRRPIVRSLYHPIVNLRDQRLSADNFRAYLTTNLPSVRLPRDREEYRTTSETMKMLLNDLYRAMITCSISMSGTDNVYNETTSRLKLRERTTDRITNRINDNLADRNQAKQRLRTLVGAWRSGDSEVIRSSLEEFYNTRLNRYRELRQN